MPKQLAGKAAFFTGGSRGIGAATARAFADEGADVVISFVAAEDKADLVLGDLERTGVNAASFKADQADPAQVKSLVDAVVERFGRLDILVNNAGVFAVGQVDGVRSNLAELDRRHAVNFGGVITAIRCGGYHGQWRSHHHGELRDGCGTRLPRATASVPVVFHVLGQALCA